MDKVSKSFYKFSFTNPLLRLCYLCGRTSGDLLHKLTCLSGFPNDSTKRKFADDYTLGVLIALQATNVYIRLRKMDKDVHGLLYDDLVKAKEKGVKAIFKFCGLPQDLVENALVAFTRDSQRNSLLSRDALAKIAPLKCCSEDRKRASKLLEEFGFPPLDQPCRLEGTLDFDEILRD